MLLNWGAMKSSRVLRQKDKLPQPCTVQPESILRVGQPLLSYQPTLSVAKNTLGTCTSFWVANRSRDRSREEERAEGRTVQGLITTSYLLPRLLPVLAVMWVGGDNQTLQSLIWERSVSSLVSRQRNWRGGGREHSPHLLPSYSSSLLLSVLM